MTSLLYARDVFIRQNSIAIKEDTIRYITTTLSKRTSLIYILVFATIVVIDSTIVDFSSYSGVEASSTSNVAIFVIFSMIFASSSIILLNSVRKSISTDTSKSAPHGLKYFQITAYATITLTIAIILIIIFQTIFLNKYNLILLQLQTYVSHIPALVFLTSLVFLFAGWLLKSKRNYVVMLYAISFSLAAINLIVSLIYLDSYFYGTATPDVKQYPIVTYVTNLSGISSYAQSLSIVFDVISLSSFLLMWIATAIFLSQYRHKMGKIKYFSLMSIPLVYYIFPLQGYFGDVFFNLLQSSPVSYSIIYILIFSATKQVGAVLFSLAFWTASTLVYDNIIRKSLLLSAIGMAILFGTFEISPLQYHVYPPYGFITQAFIPLGTYLLFVGIFSSAKVISRDSVVRKEFYKSASSQLSLLKSIGVSQMEKELEKEVKAVEKKLSNLGTETTVNIPQLEEQEVKEILHDVLNELYSKGKKGTHNNSYG
jgi:hypothetical protein